MRITTNLFLFVLLISHHILLEAVLMPSYYLCFTLYGTEIDMKHKFVCLFYSLRQAKHLIKRSSSHVWNLKATTMT